MEPNPIQLDFGPDVEFRGSLYNASDPSCLISDMAEIELPGGLIIGIGWEPERDLTGHYEVVVFDRYWSDKKAVFISSDFPTVIRTIEFWVEMFRNEESKNLDLTNG